MDNIESIKLLQENIQEEIVKEMDSLIPKIKTFVSVNHDNYPKYRQGKYTVEQINYGIIKHIYPDLCLPDELSKMIEITNEEDDNFYCHLHEIIVFVGGKFNDELWRSDLIFYNNKSGLWYVYNNYPSNAKFNLVQDLVKLNLDNTDKFMKIRDLDINTQIVFLEKLKNVLD